MKKFYLSRTFWAAIFSFVASMVLHISGFELPAMFEQMYWMVLMIVLRAITKEPVDFSL